MAKFQVFKDKAGEFRFRYRATNSEILFSSEGYKAKASALSAIESIKKNAPGAEIEDETTAEAKKEAAPKKATAPKKEAKA